MSAHERCNAVGKFACQYDRNISAQVNEYGGGYGDVAYLWWEPIDLDTECEGHEPGPFQTAGISVFCDGSCTRDWAARKHYGTSWLIARELNDGQFFVECYDTEWDRDGRVHQLDVALTEWETLENEGEI